MFYDYYLILSFYYNLLCIIYFQSCIHFHIYLFIYYKHFNNHTKEKDKYIHFHLFFFLIYISNNFSIKVILKTHPIDLH